MTDACFLPEADQDFLRLKSITYELLTEPLAGGEVRRAIVFPDFIVPSNLCVRTPGGLVAGGTTKLMVLIPKGYAKTKLDSWYARPGLFLQNGQAADRAGGEAELFGDQWQFWSRHLDASEWREGIDGLETYLQYIRAGLRCP